MKGENIMKVIVIHDANVYKALKKHNKCINNLALISIIVSACLVAKEIQIKKIEKRLDDLAGLE